ncbi:zinc-dependent alcohol dehydrogenase [Arthrobacter sp. FW306-2-2C-D06B]|uniref:zinc-dependent alcohol dehydrogenase n=1 Tax=Arthrobacter sp. FW306-2-2C-D06B TaxID=2879618 RepID=UPI001F464795|nr:zinc-binding dehydrogenase [Arthrobacter sp. FW306-2-2C-D06B]UKA60472.1 zinc-binding dehydrogenase [Arthrobacter sp. FW306-2-2C-D06B]
MEVPLPDTLADGDALARVEASGLCGSDYEQYIGNFDESGILEYPCIIGHEPLLRIDRLTPAAKERWNVEEGDRVLTWPLGCTVCQNCAAGNRLACTSPGRIRRGYASVERGLWGSLSEYMMIAANTVIHKIPEGVPAEDVLLFNPLAAGFDWAVSRGGVTIGDDVLILGSGQRGLASVVACREAGANRIIITGTPNSTEKLKIALKLGATDAIVVDPNEPSSLIDQIGSEVVDVALDVTPNAMQPIMDSLVAVRRCGTVVLGGLKGMNKLPDFVPDQLVLKSLDLRGALGYSARSQKRAIDAILSGRYDFSDWHTHTLPLDRAEEAIQILGGEIKTGRAPIHVTVMGS